MDPGLIWGPHDHEEFGVGLVVGTPNMFKDCPRGGICGVGTRRAVFLSLLVRRIELILSGGDFTHLLLTLDIFRLADCHSEPSIEVGSSSDDVQAGRYLDFESNLQQTQAPLSPSVSFFTI